MSREHEPMHHSAPTPNIYTTVFQLHNNEGVAKFVVTLERVAMARRE